MSKNSEIQIRSALISAWHKEPAIDLAKVLASRDVHIYASGGTSKAIENAGIRVQSIERFTGFSELLGGRVKTLHPVIYSAILAKRDSDSDLEQLSTLNIQPFDLVAVDLYPFEEALANSEHFPVEMIDIGGVALIRAAAKNYKWVSVLSNCADFKTFSETFPTNRGTTDLSQRAELAARAFSYTARYDSLIADNVK